MWAHVGFRDSNEKWEADPCCNHELRRYKCCPLQNVPNGQVDAVIGIKRRVVNAYCRNASLVIQMLQDMMENLRMSTECAQNLGESVGINSWQEMWKVKDTCRDKVYKAESKECEKDSDCDHCSQSVCNIESGQVDNAVNSS